ncbi:MAG: tetratricopeptide repeat protein [Cyclobacteriaceae bacterium]|nr:tetratricopeptide repeat protein [Cyclobacteriaceae bacterium]
MELQWMNTHLTQAEQMFYNNQVPEGLAVLQNLLYEEPGYAQLHNHLGWAYLYYTQDMAQAELHLKLAIRFNAAYAPPYLHLGNLLIRLARYTEALEYLHKGLHQQQANKVAFLEVLAQVYELRRDFTNAIKHYKQALVATTGFETGQLMEGIKRCQKKRWTMLFAF